MKTDPASQVPSRRRISVVGCLLITLLGCLGGYVLLVGVGGFLIEADPLQKADAIVLLSGGDESRVGEAVQIYKDKYAPLLILTLTSRNDAKRPGLGTEALRQQVIGMGVASGDILVTGHTVSSTYDEADGVAALAKSKNLRSVIVVTDPYHSRRTKMIFTSVLEPQGLKVSIRPVRSHWFRSNTWFLSLEGWQLASSEVFKLALFVGGVRLD
jgi:uncharacterized SAM-binding protein YcdF (DUF218 family)